MLLESVRQVLAANVLITRAGSSRAQINASGQVGSSGWTQPALVRRPTDDAKGRLAYDFVAKRPDGMALKVMSPISVHQLELDVPEVFRGVVVFAASGKVTADVVLAADGEAGQLRGASRIETLLAFRQEADCLYFRVRSSGGTVKEHFHVELNGGSTGLGPKLVTLYRLEPDECGQQMPEELEIAFTRDELALSRGAHLALQNPFGDLT